MGFFLCCYYSLHFFKRNSIRNRTGTASILWQTKKATIEASWSTRNVPRSPAQPHRGACPAPAVESRTSSMTWIFLTYSQIRISYFCQAELSSSPCFVHQSKTHCPVPLEHFQRFQQSCCQPAQLRNQIPLIYLHNSKIRLALRHLHLFPIEN